MVFVPPAAAAQTAAQLEHRCRGGVYVAWAAPQLLEVMPATANKGAALERLACRLGVPLAQTLAIGDGNNDLPMLRLAGCGVLMANAEPEVRAAALAAGLLVAPDVDDQGFSRALADWLR